MPVPYTFAGATSSIPLAQLDSNFATTITLGNTPIQLGNTVSTLNNMTFANVTISSVASGFPNNFLANSTATLGNATITLGGTTSSVGNLTVANVTVTNYTETTLTANTGTAYTIDLVNGTVQVLTLTGNATITMPSVIAGKSFLVLLKTGAGSFTCTFTGARWAGNSAPTFTTTASRMDAVSFVSDGTYWYGTAAQNFYV